MSLINLLILSTSGQGLFVLSFLFRVFFPEQVSDELLLQSGILAFIMQLFGIAASFLHLGSPLKATRVLNKLNHSWLSKEILTISVFTFLLALHLILIMMAYPKFWLEVTGSMAIVASGTFFISTSMVYASIRFIKEWANKYTLANFTITGFIVGGSLLISILSLSANNRPATDQAVFIVLLITFFGLITKLLTYRFNSRMYISVNEQSATGSSEPSIQLMDTGAAYQHFNTTEYHHPISLKAKAVQKRGVLLLVYLTPIVLWSASLLLKPKAPFVAGLSLLAFFSCFSGIYIERRLFFIEANHWQNLYYGNFNRFNLKNPFLTKTKNLSKDVSG
ncbi:MAG: dimethyl sulfoxide reductase anchor subunit [Deltaproteobacteria bacterium]|nr:dimethyl sulfoxide reductase anchor subunit [Deltaproteobacteria bacterium]